MIFAVVGTQKFQFNRLLKTLDELVENGSIEEEIIAQTGHSDYSPQNYTGRDFFSKEEFENNIEKCRLLITHSGASTITTGLKHGKPVIVVPRLEKYGEHVDNHQVQISRIFADRKYVMMCGENDRLSDLVKQVPAYRFAEYHSERAQIVQTIMEYLCGIHTASGRLD